MKLLTYAAGLVLAVLPALIVSAQDEPARLPMASYGSSLAEGTYVGSGAYAGHPLHDCNCENRKGYNLWCQPVGFFSGHKWGSSCGCGSPAPSCCAPEPTCCAPEPTCCAPEPTCCAPEPTCCAPEPACCAPKPTCCAPEPTCCAPEPTCCAPEPTCCAPEPTCGAPQGCCGSCGKRGLFACSENPFDKLHDAMSSLFKRKKKCCTSSCCEPCCSAPSVMPMHMDSAPPAALPDMPDVEENPFTDDPPASIPVPETTTSSSRRHGIMQAGYVK